MSNNVPRLRFKEFNDAWEENRLGDLVTYKKGYAFKTEECTSKGIRVIKISDTNENSIKNEGNTFVKESDYEKFRQWELVSDDILVSTVGSRPPLYSSMVGKVIKVPTCCEGSLLNQNLVKLSPNKLITNQFLYNVLKKPRYTKHIENICRGNANQVSITLEDLFEYRVINPKLEEQEKIANFLTKVDKIIEKQEKKVSNIENYKKGMMQKIFSQEIRFKDDNGGEHPEWEENKLSDIASLTSSKRIFLSDYVDYGVPFYRGKEIIELKANKQPKDILYITEEKYKEIRNKYGIPQKGDLLLTAVGTLGNSYLIKDDKPFYFKDGNLIWLREIKVNSLFLEYILNSDHGRKKVLDSAIGSTQKALTMVNLNKIEFKYPCIKEQNKIANFLSKIDSIVEKEKEKLEELRLWKKGLLQQMFV